MDRNLAYAGTAVVLAGLLGFSWGKGGDSLSADDSKPGKGETAVVDMNKVFAAHKGLSARNEELKREAERAGEGIKAVQDAAEKLKSELNGVKKGSAEFQRIEKELQQKALEWQKLTEEAKRKVGEIQATNFLWTYQQVSEAVQRIAEARGLKLVINFSSEPVDPSAPGKWPMIASRQVIFQDGIDITDEVISTLN